MQAVTVGDDLIMVRPSHADNPRTLREERTEKGDGGNKIYTIKFAFIQTYVITSRNILKKSHELTRMRHATTSTNKYS